MTAFDSLRIVLKCTAVKDYRKQASGINCNWLALTVTVVFVCVEPEL